jgi:hypothetical protein
MATKLKNRPQKPERATEQKPPANPAPNPPPRDCAEAPAPNPNGDLGKGGKTT